jgi:acyl carrier protein
MDDMFEKLKKIIVDKLEVEESKVTESAKIREDLGADSLDTYELVYAIEEELGITFLMTKQPNLKLSVTL